MNKINKLDFEGQLIYVGMDVHKKSWSISIFTDEFEHKTFTQPPDVGVLCTFFKMVSRQDFRANFTMRRLHQFVRT